MNSTTFAVTENSDKIDINLIVNGKLKGVTLLETLPGKENYRFAGPLLLMSLSDYLVEKDIVVLDKILSKTGYLTSNDLRKLGVEIKFNVSKSEIEISTPSNSVASLHRNVEKNLDSTPSPLYLKPNEYKSETIESGLNDSSDLLTPNKEVAQGSDYKLEEKKPSKIKTEKNTVDKPRDPNNKELAQIKNEVQEIKQEIKKIKNDVAEKQNRNNLASDSTKINLPSDTTKDSLIQKPIVVTYSLPESKDALYQKIFKKAPPKRPEKSEVNLFIDDVLWGKVWIKQTHDQKDFLMESDTLNLILENRLSTENLKKFKQLTNKTGFISGSSILSQGILPTLKLDEFELRLQIPSQLLGMQKHNLSPENNVNDPKNDYPRATFSGFLNSRAMQRYQYYQLSPNAVLSPNQLQDPLAGKNDQMRAPLLVDFDGSLNLKGVVLESRAIYYEPPKITNSHLDREDIRLIYDIPNRTTRLVAGDVQFPTSGYQSFIKMAGVGASRDFSLQPNLIVYPTKDYEFYLENEAEVKIYVNGSLVDTLLLKPGPHDLQKIPVTTGESEVRIEILDVTGRTQTVNFNFIFEPSLLEKGRSTFAYTAGIPGRSQPNRNNFNYEGDSSQFDFLGYTYETNHYLSSMAYRYGILNVWTAGIYSQSLDQNYLVGTSSLFAFSLGKLSIDVALSSTDSNGIDGAGRMSYSYVPKPTALKTKIGWNAQIEYKGEKFSQLQLNPILNVESWNFSTGIAKPLEIVTAGINFGYTLRREQKNIYNLALSFHRQLIKGLSGNVNINHFFNQKDIATTTFSANFQYAFLSGDHNFSANQRVVTHQNQLENPQFISTPGEQTNTVTQTPPQWDNSTDISWDYNSAAPFPINPKSSANISFSPNGNDYTGKMGFRTNQALLDVNARRIEPAANYSNYVQNQFDFTFQTSLVFADGHFGLSRPVQNGFLLTKGIKNLAGCEVIVNQNEVGYESKSDLFGPAVLPSLFPYSQKRIRLNVTDPPVGVSIEKTQFNLYPSYKCGYLIALGTDGDVVAMGTFNDRVGVALDYKVLKIYSLDEPNRPVLTAFTNATGRFQVAAVKSGKWKLEAVDIGSTTFTIPKNTVGIYQLGELKMEPEK